MESKPRKLARIHTYFRAVDTWKLQQFRDAIEISTTDPDK